MGSITKFGTLGKVFQSGTSDLYTGIARLVVLYEDLELEMEEFKKIHAIAEQSGTDDITYRLMYYLRRSLSTLVEFRSGLTMVRGTAEFKQAEPGLTEMDASYILDADRYLQKHGEQLKDMRNHYGGHLKKESVKSALEKYAEALTKIEWVRGEGDGWTMGLECHFAADIVAGAIASRLKGDDVGAEFSAGFQTTVEGFNHARAATLAFVHAFVWDRFGT